MIDIGLPPSEKSLNSGVFNNYGLWFNFNVMCQKTSVEIFDDLFQEELEERQKKTYQAFLESLDWEIAFRDDNRVVRAIVEKEEIEGIYGLLESGALDGVFTFLQEIGFMDLILKESPLAARRVMVPFLRYILIYMLKAMSGIEAMNALPALLFSNTYTMKLIGFNAHQIKDGICERG